MDLVLPALTYGRSLKMGLILIGQSKTAQSVGLKGRYDLMECFDAKVGLTYNKGTKLFGANVDYGDGVDVPHVPPGKFHADMPAHAITKTGTSLDMLGGTAAHDENERAVLALHDQGFSRNKICIELFDRTPKYQKIVNDILRKHGRI